MTFAARVAARRLPAAGAGERGSVSLWFAITAVAALMMAGVVVDGGAALATRERAADVATQAARAGADAFAGQSLRSSAPGGLGADPAGAAGAAQRVLDAAGATGTVAVQGLTVTVTATIRARAVLLSAIGVTDISQTATASATALVGGTTEGD
jgi:hypothetical protein